MFPHQLQERTGGLFVGPAGTCLPMPFAGDGCTIWYGGSLTIFGAPPGCKAQIVDKNNIIVAEAVVGFHGEVQFFRPPDCNFPIGMFPNMRMMLSSCIVNGTIFLPNGPLPTTSTQFTFPLFINSQNWKPKQYSKPFFNNMLYTLNGDTMMQCTRTNDIAKPIVPPLAHQNNVRSKM